MAYEKKTWEQGNIITAQNMNNIEDELYSLDGLLNKIIPDYVDLTFPISQYTYCWHSGALYKASNTIQTSESWTPAHWTLVNKGFSTEINERVTAARQEITSVGAAEQYNARNITALQTQVSNNYNKFEDLKDSIANEFDPNTPYVIGDYVWHNDTLHKFTANHNGSWSDNDFIDVILADDVKNLDNKYVKYNTAQSLTDAQKLQVRSNIDTAAKSAIAAEYTNQAYAIGDYVMHDTKLYKCKVTIASGENWTDAHWEEVPITDGFDRLNIALNNATNDLFDTNAVIMDGYALVVPQWWERGTIDVNGDNQDNNNAWRGHGYIPAVSGQKIKTECTNYNTLKFRCYDSSFVFNGSTIGTNNTDGIKTEILTVSANTAYIRPIIQLTNNNYSMSPQNVKAYTILHEQQIPMFYAHLVPNSTNAFNIDTELSKITFSSSAYVLFKTKRYQIVANSYYSYNDISDTIKYFVYDYKNNICKFIAYGNYDYTQYAVIFTINTNSTGMNFCTYYGKYTVNGGKRDFCDIAFVKTTGNDSTAIIGERGKPFKTINAALAVSNIVHVYPGIYNEVLSLTTTNRNEIEIIGEHENGTDDRIILNYGTEINFTISNGYSTASYTAESTSLMYKCFVSKTENVEVDDGATAKGYKCNLWNGDTKLIPVLSLADCQATENTWFYDGSTITAHCEATTLILADGEVEKGINIDRCEKVTLRNIDVLYARDTGCYILNARTINIDKCSFCYSGIYDGLRITNCSGEVTECLTKYNRMDGLAIHGEGSTRFINCQSLHNYDDGISHHDKSNGYILGGEYAYNGKGGVCSPTFGCKVDTNGTYIHHNQNGFYALSDTIGSETTNPTSTICNCLITNNHFGIRSRRYPIIGWNNILQDNDNDTSTENNGTITSYGITL